VSATKPVFEKVAYLQRTTLFLRRGKLSLCVQKLGSRQRRLQKQKKIMKPVKIVEKDVIHTMIHTDEPSDAMQLLT
jgi:hypothetical protein